MTKIMRHYKNVKSREPWPDRFISIKAPSSGNLRELETVICNATDERPLQDFLTRTPAVLRAFIPSVSGFWFFDRPPLGGELIPDFLVCYRNSSGMNWAYVELESPRAAPLNKAGRVSGKLNEALGQIRDWRIWLRRNIAYAQNHLRFEGIDAECPAWVVIGRRAMIDRRHAEKYRELSNGNVTVMSYDRLIEQFNS